MQTIYFWGEQMLILWRPNRKNPNKTRCKVSVLRGAVIDNGNGTYGYEVFVEPRGGKSIILRAVSNILDNGEIICPFKRTEHIMRCLTSNAMFEFLSNEHSSKPGNIFARGLIQTYCDKHITNVCGVQIQGVYKHHKSGRYYNVLLIANVGCNDKERFPVMVNYRSIVNGGVYARSLEEFLSGKFIHAEGRPVVPNIMELLLTTNEEIKQKWELTQNEN